MALPPALKEKMKDKEEVREGEADEKKGKKKPPFMKKGKKDTEIEKGPVGSEGVTKANRSSMPSLDDENNDACGKKMDKKGGKDCGCEHKNDSLTPQEYIAACNLGIQDRSRIYIRARLDAEQRDDAGPGTGKKCGNSHIPRGATCQKNGGGGGGASKPKPKKIGLGNQLRTGLAVASSVQGSMAAFKSARAGKLGTAIVQANAAIGNARAAQSYSQGNARQGARRQLAHMALGAGLATGIYAGNYYARTPKWQGAARSAGEKAGRAYRSTVGRPVNAARGAAQSASNAAFSVEQRMRGFKKMKRPNGKYGLAKRDSPWANGFSVNDAESALSANAMNLATDKYSNEKRKWNAQGQPHNIIYANTFNT